MTEPQLGAWQRYRSRFLGGCLLLGLALGVRTSLERLGGLDPVDLPTRAATATSLGLILGGQLLVGYGWRRLVPSLRDPVASMWTFHATQPGKYLPVGVGQAVGQVVLARDLGMPTGRAVASWAAHIATIVAAGVAAGTLIVARSELGPGRWLAVGGVLGVAVVHRPVLQRLVLAGERIAARLPKVSDLPGQRSLTEAFVAGLGFIVLHGLAFGILLGGPDEGGVDGWLGLIGAYGIATGLSILTPLPAGLGVREALLVLLTNAGAVATVAAAVVLRISTFGVEVLLVAVFAVLRKHR